MAAYALLAASYGARVLCAADWLSRTPRLGILAWQCLSASVILAVTLASLVLLLGLPHVSHDLASWTDLCEDTLHDVYNSPTGATVSLLGGVLFGVSTARLVYCAIRVARRQNRKRRRLAALVDMLAVSNDPRSQTSVIQHAVPYAFCVPGSRPRVVVTSALLEKLTQDQLAAVLAHEQAHMSQRHHLVLQLSQTFVAAFGVLAPFLKTAHEQTVRLVELLADDTARRSSGDRPLAMALATLTDTPVNSCALAASAVDVEERVLRLRRGQPPLRPFVVAAVSLLVLLLAAVPVAVAVAPALSAGGWHGLCFVA